jgi:hypothetical protein
MNRFAEITDKLQSLERIVFVYVGMDVTYLQCLMHLCNLKSLKWMIGKDDVIPWEVEETLAKVFEHFEVKPKIEVKGWVYNLSRWPDDGRARW